MADQQQSQPPAATPDPISEADVMAGTEQFTVYTGDFMADELDADRSGESGAPAAAPSNDGTPGPQADPPASPPLAPDTEPPAAAPSDDGTAGPPADPSEAPPETEGPAGAESGKTEFRHKTLEDAEKTAKYYMRRATTAEEARKKAEQELEDMRTARVQAERDEQARAQKQEFVTQTYEEANRQVDELDADDPEYHHKVANIWAGVHAQIDAFTPQIEDPPPPASAALSSDPPGSAPEAEGMTRGEITAKIDEVLAAEKVDFAPDDPAFVAICGRTPAADEAGSPLSIEDQIRHAVTQTRAHYDRLLQKHRQQTEQPLPRAGGGRPAGQEASHEKASSFGDVIDEAVSSRTL